MARVHRLAGLVAAIAAASASDSFQVEFDVMISKGQTGRFVVEVYPEWAPLGAQRFREIIEAEIWNAARFYSVVPGRVVQWGIPGRPTVAAAWLDKKIEDDPLYTKDDPTTQVALNKRGTIAFNAATKHTRVHGRAARRQPAALRASPCVSPTTAT